MPFLRLIDMVEWHSADSLQSSEIFAPAECDCRLASIGRSLVLRLLVRAVKDKSGGTVSVRPFLPWLGACTTVHIV